ncbi:MAG: sulfite exporter TauE/SafE family protein [Opitutales bacterium]|nr:sulfite exporter TauE/SafE family protein [Opitutales bacterium]
MEIYWILLPMALIAALYASVGHGGASGYLAVMTLAGMAPEVMKPTALCLNMVVSMLALVAFGRAGYFRPGLFWPFALVSIPFAFAGGRLNVDPGWFHALVAVVLAFSAVRLCMPAAAPGGEKKPSFWIIAVTGSLMGFVSGLIGVGGGIFLTPLLLFFGWARPKVAAAVSAPFIFVNSAAGLLGHSGAVESLPMLWMVLAPAVLLGGYIGARWGSGLAHPHQIRRALAVVLVVATLKIAFT